MSNLHPATAPHIRRAIARRQRRDQFARVALFGSSCAVCMLSMFPLAAIARGHEFSEQQRALAAAGLMGATAMAGASLVCAAASATESQ
tara:strand:- start:554 stop:820 length:267 start_codon:yes stop_codon:yes gene_type:complete